RPQQERDLQPLQRRAARESGLAGQARALDHDCPRRPRHALRGRLERARRPRARAEARAARAAVPVRAARRRGRDDDEAHRLRPGLTRRKYAIMRVSARDGSMTEIPTLELEEFALELARTAGGIAQAHFRRPYSVDNKDENGFDPVTAADRAIERVLRAAIVERYPAHGIVGEEEAVRSAESPYTWYIDPI